MVILLPHFSWMMIHPLSTSIFNSEDLANLGFRCLLFCRRWGFRILSILFWYFHIIYNIMSIERSLCNIFTPIPPGLVLSFQLLYSWSPSSKYKRHRRETTHWHLHWGDIYQSIKILITSPMPQYFLQWRHALQMIC